MGVGAGGPGRGRKSRPCTQGAEIWPVKKSGEFNPWRLRACGWEITEFRYKEHPDQLTAVRRKLWGPGLAWCTLGQLQGPFWDRAWSRGTGRTLSPLLPNAPQSGDQPSSSQEPLSVLVSSVKLKEVTGREKGCSHWCTLVFKRFFSPSFLSPSNSSHRLILSPQCTHPQAHAARTHSSNP